MIGQSPLAWVVACDANWRSGNNPASCRTSTTSSCRRHSSGKPSLDARALFLGPTYRIHGTNQLQTIGNAVFAGCYRLTNADVIDLYGRVAVGTKIVVRQRPTL